MRKEKMNQKLSKLMMGMLALVLALTLGLFADAFAIVSHAESTAKVTASSAKIRKEASTSSEVLGSVAKDTKISIISQVNGSDGYVWYQTYANATTTGYVRSDLVQITDGSTPDTGASETAGGVSDAGVTKINPISATVSGGSSVRIRSQASTSGKIVTTASNGLALTVNGTINGSDGKVWYLVSYSANGSEVSGYIRSDFVTLSGEITPLTETPVETTETPVETPETPVETKEPEELPEYGLAEVDGVWYLTRPRQGDQLNIEDELINKANNNAAAYEKAHKKAQNEKVIIIILVIVLLGAAAVIAYLLMKIKDMADNAYYRQVENETLKRRGAQQGQKQVQQKQAAQKQAQPAQQGQKTGEPKKVMQTVGEEKPAQGARPAQAQQGTRPAGQGARPAQGQGQRPTQAQGARPAQGQGQRPAGQGTRPAGAQPTQQASRPVGTRPAQAQGARPAQATQQAAKPAQPQAKKPILTDDDEFEFDFLNELDKE